jgi:hypothetical protein
MSAEALQETPVPYRTAESESPYAPLIDELYREEVLEARAMKAEDKFLLGEELFHYACSITLEGIRNQNPGFDDAACRQELARRLELRARMERIA